MTCPVCSDGAEAAAGPCPACGGVRIDAATALARGSLVASRYEVGDAVGQGGMGIVFKARDRVLDETVALKVLRSGQGVDPDAQRRFRSEIKLARKVRHDNVCAIHEYGEAGGLRYIAMEFIEGVDLGAVLALRGPLPPAQAFMIAIQTARGLRAIHDAGIIHRDLKAANVMIDAKGVARVMDFGLAKQHGVDTTLAGAVIGTPYYMSPEQARGQEADFRSDVYSLGVVIFEIFTRVLPFRGDDAMSVAMKHLSEPPPLEGEDAAALPPALRPVLRKALAKEPAERHQTVQQLIEDLEQAYFASGPFEGATPLSLRAAPRPVAPPAAGAADGWPSLRGAMRAGREAAAAETLIEDALTVTHLSKSGLLATTLRPSATTVGVGAPSPKRRGLVPAAAASLAVALATTVLLWRSASPPSRTAAPQTMRALEVPPPPAADTTEIEDPQPAAGLAAAAPAEASEPAPRPGALEPRSEPSPEAAPTVETVAAAPAPPPVELSPSPPAVPAEPGAAQALPASAEAPLTPAAGNVSPVYPPDMLEKGIEGVVNLKVVVSESGDVEDVQVLSGAEPFATAASSAVRSWRFSPYLLDGRPAVARFVLRVPFRLRQR